MSLTSLVIHENNNQKSKTKSININVSGGGKLVLQVLEEDNQKFEIKIDEIEPDFFKIGLNLNEVKQLQLLHESLFSKFKAKTHEIIGRLTRDGIDLILIENSLSNISFQFELRQNLLDKAKKFFKNMKAFDDKINDAFHLDDRNEYVKGDIFDLFTESLNNGREMLTQIDKMKNHCNIIKTQLFKTVSNDIQKFLELLNEKKVKFESEWEDHQIKLNIEFKLQCLNDRIQKTYAQILNEAESYFDGTRLGSDLNESIQLQNEHLEFEKRFNQLFHEVVVECVNEADGTFFLGSSSFNNVQERANELLELWKKYSLKLDHRRKLLSILISFYKKAEDKLDQLKIEENINKVESNAQEDYFIDNTFSPKKKLIERFDYSKEENKNFSEFSQQIRHIKSIMEHKFLQNSANFEKEYFETLSWIANVGESYLEQHRDFGTSITYISDYVDNHEQMLADLKEFDKKIETLRNMDNFNQEQHKIIQERFYKLRKAVENRILLSYTYLEFIKLIHEQRNLAFDIQELINLYKNKSAKTNFEKFIDEKIELFEKCYEEIRKSGRGLINELKNTTNEVRLNINHILSNIEMMMNDSKALFEIARNIIELWRHETINELEYQEEWEEILRHKKRIIDESNRLQDELIQKFAPNENITEYYKRIEDYMQNLNKILADIKQIINRSENFTILSGKNHFKVEIIKELSNYKQNIQSQVNEFQELIRFYKNYQKVDDIITNLQDKYKDLKLADDLKYEADYLQKENENLFRLINQIHIEGDLIIDRTARNEVLRIEIDRMLKRIKERKTSLDRIIDQVNEALKMQMDTSQILAEKDQILHEIDVLIEEVERRKVHLGQSLNEIRTTKNDFKEVLIDINICTENATKWKNSVEIFLENSNEKQKLRENLTKVDKKISTLHFLVQNYQESLDKSVEFFQECSQVEKWLSEKTIMHDKLNSEKGIMDSNILKGRILELIEEITQYERTKLRYLSELAIEIYGETKPELFKHIVIKNAQLLNNCIDLKEFIENNQPLSIKSKYYRSIDIEEKQVAPDFIVKRLESAIVKENTVHIFECVANGSKPLEIKWFKNGIELNLTKTEQYFHSFNDETQLCRLELKNVQFTDNGLYSCRVTNSLGMAETSAYLRVKEELELRGKEPKIITPLESCKIESGQDYTLECVMSGEPEPTITWFKDEEEIYGDQDYKITQISNLRRLTIRNANVNKHSGSYMCKAQNDLGTAECNCLILVKNTAKIFLKNPIITIPLLPLYTVSEGSSLILNCCFDAPESESNWYHNDHLIDNSNESYEITSFGKNQTQLKIKKGSKETSGDYRLLIKNSSGQTFTSTNVIVEELVTSHFEMKTIKPTVLTSLQDIIANEGDYVQFECSIKSEPKAEIKWFLNDKLIKESCFNRIESNGDDQSLIIEKCTFDDCGEYKIIATNYLGRVESKAKLIVNIEKKYKQPLFIESLQNTEFNLGNSICLKCKVTSDLPCQIKWYKDDLLIEESSNIKMAQQKENYYMVITESSASDSGMYMAEASNSVGVSRSYGKVEQHVEESMSTSTTTANTIESQKSRSGHPPEFKKIFYDKIAKLGENVKLETIVSGSPKPKVTWCFENGPVLHENCRCVMAGDTYSFIITDFNIQNIGRYSITAENTHGKATCSAEVTVEGYLTDVNRSVTEKTSNSQQYLQVNHHHQQQQQQEQVMVSSSRKVSRQEMHQNHQYQQSDFIVQEQQQVPIIKESNSVHSGGFSTTLIKDVDGSTHEDSNSIHYKKSSRFEPVKFVVQKKFGNERSGSLPPGARVVKAYNYDFALTDAEDDVLYYYTTADDYLESHRLRDDSHVTYVKETRLRARPVELEPVEYVLETRPVRRIRELSLPAARRIRIPYYQIEYDDSASDFIENDERYYRAYHHAENYSNSREFILNQSQTTNENRMESTTLVSETCGSPIIEKQLVDLVVNEREDAKIECILRGTPTPVVKWYKDGREILSENCTMIYDEYTGVSTLILRKVKQEDTAKYTCAAKNSVGACSTSCFIRVNGAPVLEPEPIVQTVKQESVKIAQQTESTVVESTTTTQTSTHVVSTHVEAIVQPIVPEPQPAQPENIPVFNKKLLPELRKYEGQSARFEISVSGYPEPQVSWYKDTIHIKNSPDTRITSNLGTHTLVIPEIFFEDCGVYKAVASNSQGTVESTCRLIVEAPFDEYQRQQQAFSSATVSVQNNYTVQQELTEIINNVQDQQKQSYYSQTEVRPAQEQVDMSQVVTQKSTHESTKQVQKTIIQEKPVLLKHIQNVSVSNGQSASFECIVKNPHDCQTRWYRNGDVIYSSNDFSFEFDQQSGRISLNINSVRVEDSGEYTCVITNSAGETQTTAWLIAKEEKVETPEPQVQKPQVAHIEKAERTSQKSSLNISNVTSSQVEEHIVQERESTPVNPVEAYLEPKFITTLPPNVKLQEGEQISLSCQVSGHPVPNVTWLKDGKPLPPSIRFVTNYSAQTGVAQLTVSSSLLTDCGNYTAVAENEAGKAYTTSQVFIKEAPNAETCSQRSVRYDTDDDVPLNRAKAPKVIHGLQSLKHTEGESVQMACKIDAFPKPKITWLKDGLPLQASNRLTTQYDANTGVARLRISDCNIKDAGLYSVVAENKAGSDHTDAQLQVIRETNADVHPPRILVQINDVTAKEGEVATFMTRIEGTPIITVSWLMNGKPLNESKRYITKFDANTGTAGLKITQVNVSDEGSITIVVQNQFGKAHSSAKLNVIRTPSVDQTPIVNPEAFRYVNQSRTQSRAASEAPQHEAPKVIVNLCNTKLHEGGYIFLACKIVGTPRPTITWFKDGKPLQASNRFTQDYDFNTCVASLKIDNANMNDLGVYIAYAENHVGNAKTDCQVYVTKVASVDQTPIVNPDAFRYIERPVVKLPTRQQVESKQPPRVAIPLQSLKIKEDQPIYLACKIEGEPKPTITWFKDSKPLQASNRIRTNFDLQSNVASLKINNALINDAGNYLAYAENEVGSDQTFAEVKVEKVPGIDKTPIVNPDAFKYIEQPSPRSQPTFDENEPMKPPKVLVPLQNVRFTEDEPIYLACKFDGHPKPVISWFKDSLPLPASNRVKTNFDFSTGVASLKIEHAQLNDVGKYACFAENDAGSDGTNCSLTVTEDVKVDRTPIVNPDAFKYLDAPKHQTHRDDMDNFTPPKIVVPLNNVKVKEGQPLYLACKVEGSPKPNTVWFKDGKPLPASNRIQTSFDLNSSVASLKIDNCQMNDIGSYLCYAENEVGSDQTECKAVITPTSGIDDTPIVNPEAFRYLEHPSRNRTGKDTSEKQVPPKIIVPLTNVKMEEGCRILLACKVEGLPKPKVTWFKDSIALQASTRFTADHDYHTGIATLKIDFAKAQDVGQYMAVAENPLGKDQTECTVFVTTSPNVDTTPMVNPDAFRYLNGNNTGRPFDTDTEENEICPPRVIVPLSDVKIVEGQSVLLVCKIDGYPKPKLSFFKNNEQLMASQRYDFDYNIGSGIATLNIKASKLIDEGVYKVVAENKVGKCETECRLLINPVPNVDETPFVDPEAFLSFEQAPRINLPQNDDSIRQPVLVVKELKDQECNEGDTISFVCEVRGYPKPEIEWTKDGQPLKFSQRFFSDYFIHEGKEVLIIQDVKSADEGKYSLTAKNAAGTSSASASLKVRLVPSIDDKSYVNPDVFQRFENNKLNQDVKPVNEVPLLQKGEPRLKIVEPLKEFYLIEGAEAFFSCKIDSNPKAEVNWFKNNQALKASERFSTYFDLLTGLAVLRIKSAFKDDKGEYKCVVSNIVGTESTCAKLVVQESPSIDQTSYMDPNVLKTLESIKLHGEHPGEQDEAYKKPYFIKVPKSLEVREGAPVRLDCVVFGRPIPTLTWYKNGIQIADDKNHKLLINEEGVHSLFIPSAGRADADTYSCVARNKAGEASFSLDLKIADKDAFIAPYFIEHLTNMTINEGKDAVLSSTCCGTPVPSITWRKDDAILTPDKEFRIDINGGHTKLHIQNADKAKHEGWYQITAENNAGTAVTRTKVTVLPAGATEFKQVDLNKYVKPPVTPETPDFFSALQNLKRVQPDASKQPKNREPEVVGQSFGSIWSKDELQEEDTMYNKDRPIPPKFKTHFRPQLNLMEYDPARFEAKLIPIGDPTMKIEWYRNGEPLRQATRYVLKYDFGLVSLDMGWTFPADDGVYECVATNSVGQDRTRAELKCRGKRSIIYDTQLPEGMEGVLKLQDMEEKIKLASMIREDLPEDDKPEPSAPKFIMNLVDAHVNEGEIVKFMVKATGYPKPRISWFVNKAVAMNGSRFKIYYDGMIHYLDIPRTIRADEGIVKCVAKNSKGEAESTAKLSLNHKSDYRSHLINAKTGEPAFVEPTVRDETRHLQRHRERSKSQERKPVYINEQVIANKAAQKKEKIKKEDPRVKPHFTRELEASKAKEGMAVILEVEFSGFPTPLVSWYKDGYQFQSSKDFPIEITETKTTLTIKEAFISDSGVYQVKLFNEVGVAQTKAYLKVTAIDADDLTPIVVENLENVTASCGDPVKFQVKAQSPVDPMTVTWFKDDEKLNITSRFKEFNEDNSYTLIILETEPSDSGSYEAVIENAHGKVFSRANLTVIGTNEHATETVKDTQQEERQPGPKPIDILYNQPYIEVPLADQEVKEGSTVKFECVIPNHENVSIQWFKNIDPIKQSKYFDMKTVENTHTLTILEAFPEDEGEYKCVVTNPAGSTSTAAYLKIELLGQPPVFVTKLKDTEAAKGHSIQFEVEVTGDPEPQVEWSLNGQLQIKNSNNFTITDKNGKHTLLIKKVGLEHAGTYSCLASNSYAKVESKAKLKIITVAPTETTEESTDDQQQYEEQNQQVDDSTSRRKTQTKQTPISIEFTQGTNARLEVSFESLNVSSNQIFWSINGKRIDSARKCNIINEKTTTILQFNNISLAEAGVYSIQVKNEQNASLESSFKIDIKSKLMAQTNPQKYLPVRRFSLNNENNKLVARESSLEDKKNQKVEESLLVTKPNIMKKLEPEVKSEKGKNIELETQLESCFNTKIEWFFQDKVISKFNDKHKKKYEIVNDLTSNTTKLLIKSPEPSDSGNYFMKATNAAGSSISKCNVIIEVPKPAPVQVKKQEVKKEKQKEPEKPAEPPKPAFVITKKTPKKNDEVKIEEQQKQPEFLSKRLKSSYQIPSSSSAEKISSDLSGKEEVLSGSESSSRNQSLMNEAVKKTEETIIAEKERKVEQVNEETQNQIFVDTKKPIKKIEPVKVEEQPKQPEFLTKKLKSSYQRQDAVVQEEKETSSRKQSLNEAKVEISELSEPSKVNSEQTKQLNEPVELVNATVTKLVETNQVNEPKANNESIIIVETLNKDKIQNINELQKNEVEQYARDIPAESYKQNEVEQDALDIPAESYKQNEDIPQIIKEAEHYTELIEDNSNEIRKLEEQPCNPIIFKEDNESIVELENAKQLTKEVFSKATIDLDETNNEEVVFESKSADTTEAVEIREPSLEFKEAVSQKTLPLAKASQNFEETIHENSIVTHTTEAHEEVVTEKLEDNIYQEIGQTEEIVKYDNTEINNIQDAIVENVTEAFEHQINEVVNHEVNETLENSKNLKTSENENSEVVECSIVSNNDIQDLVNETKHPRAFSFPSENNTIQFEITQDANTNNLKAENLNESIAFDIKEIMSQEIVQTVENTNTLLTDQTKSESIEYSVVSLDQETQNMNKINQPQALIAPIQRNYEVSDEIVEQNIEEDYEVEEILTKEVSIASDTNLNVQKNDDVQILEMPSDANLNRLVEDIIQERSTDNFQETTLVHNIETLQEKELNSFSNISKFIIEEQSKSDQSTREVVQTEQSVGFVQSCDKDDNSINDADEIVEDVSQDQNLLRVIQENELIDYNKRVHFSNDIEVYSINDTDAEADNFEEIYTETYETETDGDKMNCNQQSSSIPDNNLEIDISNVIQYIVQGPSETKKVQDYQHEDINQKSSVISEIYNESNEQNDYVFVQNEFNHETSDFVTVEKSDIESEYLTVKKESISEDTEVQNIMNQSTSPTAEFKSLNELMSYEESKISYVDEKQKASLFKLVQDENQNIFNSQSKNSLLEKVSSWQTKVDTEYKNKNQQDQKVELTDSSFVNSFVMLESQEQKFDEAQLISQFITEELQKQSIDQSEEISEETSESSIISVKKVDTGRPVFTETLKDIEYFTGDNLHLDCTVKGNTPIDISWYKNGILISEETDNIEIHREMGICSLEIISASIKDQGVYKCVASNAKGKEETICKLSKTESECRFVEKLKDQIVELDSEVYLDCTIEGMKTNYSVKWLFNNNPINKDSSNENIEIFQESNICSLQIRRMNSELEGRYNCSVLSEENGYLDSTECKIIVKTENYDEMMKTLEISPIFVKDLKEVEIYREGETITLVCHLNHNCNPKPSIQWFLNGVNVASFADRLFEISFTPETGRCELIKNNCSAVDGGIYVCAAVTEGSSDISAFTSSKVKILPSVDEIEQEEKPEEVMPIFLQKLENAEVEESETIELKCQIMGSPMPEISWYFIRENEKPVKIEASNYDYNTENGIVTLTIRNASRSQEGNYLVEAENSIGIISHLCHVKVNSKQFPSLEQQLDCEPKFIFKLPESLSVMDGQTVNLTCICSCDIKTEITWLRINQDGSSTQIQSNKEFRITYDQLTGKCSLKIVDSYPQDSGTYICKAQNNRGKDETQCTLKVEPYSYLKDSEEGSASEEASRYSSARSTLRSRRGIDTDDECVTPTNELSMNFFSMSTIPDAQAIDEASERLLTLQMKRFEQDLSEDEYFTAESKYTTASESSFSKYNKPL